jgi:hypothetical protein
VARESPEFVGLDSRQTARALDAGRRILKLAGIEPPGFIAPAYAYTPALRESLRTRFAWWAGAWGLHPTRAGATRQVCAPPISLAAAGPLRRAMSPSLLRLARPRVSRPHARARGRHPPRDARPRVRHLRRSRRCGLET